MAKLFDQARPRDFASSPQRLPNLEKPGIAGKVIDTITDSAASIGVNFRTGVWAVRHEIRSGENTLKRLRYLPEDWGMLELGLKEAEKSFVAAQNLADRGRVKPWQMSAQTEFEVAALNAQVDQRIKVILDIMSPKLKNLGADLQQNLTGNEKLLDNFVSEAVRRIDIGNACDLAGPEVGSKKRVDALHQSTIRLTQVKVASAIMDRLAPVLEQQPPGLSGVAQSALFKYVL